MSRTFKDRPDHDRPAAPWSRGREAATFRCRRCKRLVGPPPSGGRHRNHCPFCLYSRHVDGRTPGDRASDCGAGMAPVAVFARRNGEEVLVHRCLGCGFERHNRVAADDDADLVLALPRVDVPRCQSEREEADLTA